MTWRAIARKDVRDAARSWWLWGLTAVFVVFFTVPAYFLASELGGFVAAEGGELNADAFIGLLADINAFFVPIIAIVLAYASIAGERDSGSIKLLLSLPHSRRDVVVGKWAGRGAVVAVPIAIGFVVAAAVFLLTPVTFAPATYAAFVVLTVVLGLVFVGIAVGISAAAPTGRRAMIGTVGVYVLFTLFWNRFARGLVGLLNEYTGIGNETLLWTELFVKVLNPSHAYKSLAAVLYTDGAFAARFMVGFNLPAEFIDAYREEFGPLPAIFSDPVLVILLLAWLVLPPLLGYLVFERDDL